MKLTFTKSVALALLLSGTAIAEDKPTATTPSIDLSAPAEPTPEIPATPELEGVTDAETPATVEKTPEEKLADALVMREGSIDLPGGIVRVNVGKGFAFLDAKDAKTLLVDLYGNPPEVASDVLGVIVPTNIHVLAQESWVAVITYEDDGHVSDDDAASINYEELLAEMKSETAEASKEREKAGYGTMQLIGWAQKPSYDKAAHKLHWAKELRFGKADTNTLNYAIRALGRTGVVQVNIVAGINQLKDINPQVPELLQMVEFTKGQTYADFNADTDQVAAYGLAGLIAGGVAAKAGLFKGLIALLLASKKLLIALIVGLGATIWSGINWLRGRKNDGSDTGPSSEA